MLKRFREWVRDIKQVRAQFLAAEAALLARERWRLARDATECNSCSAVLRDDDDAG